MITGKYKVLDVLGQGGFGTVYRVEITAGMVGEQLALKLLPEELSSQPAFRNQFLNEIRVAMRVVDRYIAQIRDVGTTEDGLLYYTMDLCPGVTLAQVLRNERRLPVTRTLLIILNVLRGLQTAHAAGIIHRDLKPANLMVQSQGGKDTVRILDFGIATAIQTTGERPRGFAGSPHYMPPEQFMGEQLGFYTDLYSVGVILYECLTGERPYSGSSAQEVFKALKTRTPAPLNAALPGAASYPGLNEVVMKAIEKNPERRFQSARELFDAVNAVLAQATAPGTSPEKASISAPQQDRGAPGSGAAGAPPAVRATPVRIRRRRPKQRQGSHASTVAFGTLIIGGTIAGVLFNQNIAQWWKSRMGDHNAPVPAVSSTEAPGAPPEEKQRANDDRAKTKPASDAKSIAEQKAAAKAELAARVNELLDDVQRAFNSKDWPLAIERADTVLGFDSRNASAHRLRGLAALKLLDFKTADASLEKARGLENEEAAGSASAQLLSALAEAKMNLTPPQLAAAEALAREAVTAEPKDAASTETLVRVLDRQGKRAEARKLLATARTGKVESAGLDQIARRFDSEEAGKLREEALAATTEARGALERNDFARAAELAARSLELAPTEAAYLVEADSLLELKQLAKAKAVLEDARTRSGRTGAESLKIDDLPGLEGRLELVKGLGILSQAGDRASDESIAGAKAALQNAREKLSRSKDVGARDRLRRLAVLSLGEACARRGDSAGVLDALGSLEAEEDPSALTEAARILAQLARRTRDKGEQSKVHKRTAALAERISRGKGASEAQRAEASFLLGGACLALGDLEQKEAQYRLALAHFAAAEKAGLKSKDLYEGWAAAYDRVGNIIRAAQLYRSAYEVAPSPEACLRAVEYYLNANPKSPEAMELLRQGRGLFKSNADLEKKYKEVLE